MKNIFELKHFSYFSESSVHKSLKQTSEDTDKNPTEYMSEIKTSVIDFDEVKKDYLKENGMTEDNAKSVDALYICENKICFTEFKNGEFSSNEIVEKALSSALMFMDITGCQLSEFREKTMFVLVYNEEVKKPNSRQCVAGYMAKKSRKYYSKFQLDHLHNFCFGEIAEVEKKDFDNSRYVAGIRAY